MIALFGLAILGASLFVWTKSGYSNQVYYTTHEYKRVLVTESTEPAVAKDEIWRASAECLKPFYVNAVQRIKARLLTHNKTRPPVSVREAQKPRSSFEIAMQQSKAIAEVAKRKG